MDQITRLLNDGGLMAHMECIIIIVIVAINGVPSMSRSSAKELYMTYLVLIRNLIYYPHFTDDET